MNAREHDLTASLDAAGARWRTRALAAEQARDEYHQMARHAEEQLVAEHPEFDKWETTIRIREAERLLRLAIEGLAKVPDPPGRVEVWGLWDQWEEWSDKWSETATAFLAERGAS